MAERLTELVPIPPSWKGKQRCCMLSTCGKSFNRNQQIAVLRYKKRRVAVFCSVMCMNLAAWCFISVDEISACELWTYFPVMGKGALVSQRSKYAQSRDRFKKPGVARGRGK